MKTKTIKAIVLALGLVACAGAMAADNTYKMVLRNDAQPASVIVECDKETISADHDFLTAKTSLSVYLSQAAEVDVPITLKTTFESDGTKTDWGNYVRFSTVADMVTTLPAANEVTITIPAGSTEKRIVYVYTLRGDTHTTGDGHQVKFTPYVDPAVMAAAGIQDLTPAGLWISAAKPVITTPDTTSTYEVTAGESLEINVAIEDTYADMTDTTTGYQVKIKTGSTASWTTLPERFKVSGEEGELIGLTSGTPPTIEYSAAGTQTSQIQVISPISQKTSETVQFPVRVAPAKTTSATSLDPDPDNYTEGDVVRFRMALSAQNDTGKPIYAFLLCNEEVDLSLFGGTAAKAILTNADVAVSTSVGRQISTVGTYVDSSFTVLDGLSEDDASQNYTFSVVLCSKRNYDPNFRLLGYDTTEMLNITVYNKEPKFTTVSLNGFEADGDGYTFPSKYPMGQNQTILPEFDDVSYDLKHGFEYKWTAICNGQPFANGTVAHDTNGTVTETTTTTNSTGVTATYTTVVPDGTSINEVPFVYHFPYAGIWTVTIQMKDKDMDDWSDVSYSISFVVQLMATVDGVTWIYELCNAEKARIVGTDTTLTGNVTIPSELDGNVVVALAESALKNAHGVTGIVIPKSVVQIEDGAFSGLEEVLAQWYKSLAELVDGGTSYGLGENVADKTVASITVSDDATLGDFVLAKDKVYDSVVHIVNTADHEIRIILPEGYSYRVLKGSRPLTVPAHSECVLTITRLSAQIFLVTVAELEVLQ